MKGLRMTKALCVRQCSKYAFLNYHKPELKSSETEIQKFMLQNSELVEEFGKKLFTGGVDLSMGGTITGDELVQQTSYILHSNKSGIFYKPAFYNKDENLYCQSDVLIKSEVGIEIIVIKSSTKIKRPAHIFDAGYQWRVYQSYEKLKKAKIHLLYIDRDYVRGETLDLERLFVLENVNFKAKGNQPLITDHFRNIEEAFEEDVIPKVNMGRHCKIPYKCEFTHYCEKKLKKTAIMKLNCLTDAQKEYFINLGITDVSEIPRDAKLTDEQWTEIDSSIEDTSKINKKWVKKFVKDLEPDGPLTFMDFETISSPIPKYIGNRPYEQLPFQYCILSRPNKDAPYERKEFIAEVGLDPSKQFIERFLIDIQQTKGKIVVYYEKFEKACLEALSTKFPKYKTEIDDVLARIVDLSEPFSEKKYYHPLFKGRYSLKVILPVIYPSLSYDKLLIRDGIAAMYYYSRLRLYNNGERLNILRALREYCYTDVLAMVKILDELMKI